MSAEDMSDYKEFPTKESALDWLDNYLSLDERNNLMRALSQEPKEHGEQTPCENDVINRREAIKKFKYNYKGERIPDYDCDNWPVQIPIKKVREMLKELPPAKLQPCKDAVSREDIEECKELMTDVTGDTVYAVRMSEIRQLPPVNLQPICEECEKG